MKGNLENTSSFYINVENRDMYQYLNLMPIAFTAIRVIVDEVGAPIDFICEFANKEFAILENKSAWKSLIKG